jgi:hypothetical protein
MICYFVIFNEYLYSASHGQPQASHSHRLGLGPSQRPATTKARSEYRDLFYLCFPPPPIPQYPPYAPPHPKPCAMLLAFPQGFLVSEKMTFLDLSTCIL